MKKKTCSPLNTMENSYRKNSNSDNKRRADCAPGAFSDTFLGVKALHQRCNTG